jgi:hypothetical protein
MYADSLVTDCVIGKCIWNGTIPVLTLFKNTLGLTLTVARTDGGRYRVTHNLGANNVPTIWGAYPSDGIGAGGGIAYLMDIEQNYFIAGTENSHYSITDGSFYFKIETY